jgi:hypothetical protein
MRVRTSVLLATPPLPPTRIGGAGVLATVLVKSHGKACEGYGVAEAGNWLHSHTLIPAWRTNPLDKGVTCHVSFLFRWVRYLIELRILFRKLYFTTFTRKSNAGFIGEAPISGPCLAK